MSPKVLGNARLLGSYIPGTPKWHDVRKGRIGASEIAAVLGLSKWQSPFSLWHLKSGNITPEPDNREMEWGRDLEALIARRFARRHPEWRIARSALYADRDRPWQCAQPDRVIHYGNRNLAALEIKTARNADEWGTEGTDEIPIYYRCQAMWQLDTFGWDRCHVTVLIAGSDLREYAVTYDPVDAALLRTEARRFLTTLDTRTPPDIDSHPATYRAVRELHPDINGTDIEVPPELASEYMDSCAALTDAEDRKRGATARLTDAMGASRRAICNKERIAIRVPGKNGAPPHLRPATTSSRKESA